MTFFIEIEKTVLQFTWNLKGLHTTKAILRKNNKPESIMFPDFKPYYKAIVIQTELCWHWSRLIHQWNRQRLQKNNTKNKIAIANCTVLLQGLYEYKMGKYCLLSKQYWENCISIWKAMKLYSLFTMHKNQLKID